MDFSEENGRAGATKGIILAGGGLGNQLHPTMEFNSKELMLVHDKPMIYYPLWTLILAGIRDILIISSPGDLRSFMELLGNGSRLGISISYGEQPADNGIADSLVAAERFIGDDSVCLMPGDSIVCGESRFLREAAHFREGATLFACRARKPRRRGAHPASEGRRCPSAPKREFESPAPRSQHPKQSPPGRHAAARRRGSCTVVEFDRTGKSLVLQEGPTKAPSDYTILGLYFFDNKVVDIARRIQWANCLAAAGTRTAGFDQPGMMPRNAWQTSIGPSQNEGSGLSGHAVVCLEHQPARHDPQLEIIDLYREYLVRDELRVFRLASDTIWLHAETDSDAQEAGDVIAEVERRHGLKIGCIEEAAFRMGFIDAERLGRLARDLPPSGYRERLRSRIQKRAASCDRRPSGRL